MIPLKYNVRNLRVRSVTTLMTVFGTGLLVWASCILFMLVDGLEHSLHVSGDPLNLIILRKGSTNESNGGFTERNADDVYTVSGIARDEKGTPLVAKEMVSIPIAERPNGQRTNIIIRGVSPASPVLRQDFKIVQGRYFEPGKGEAIVSKNMSRRFKGANVGGVLQFGEKESYRVVGLFTAGGGPAESEVWTDLKDLMRNVNREGYVSSVHLRAATPTDLDRIKKTLDNETQFKLSAQHEADYYASQQQSSLFLKGAGILIAVLLSIGAMFCAANTMYATIRARSREIGTMRALGFSRWNVLISFLFESVLLCALGGLLGLLATLPLNALSYSTLDFNSFAEINFSFRTGPIVMVVAFVMTFAMGVFGGLFPAIRAVRLDVVRSLREV
jgi:putative ABC transport system permease protein